MQTLEILIEENAFGSVRPVEVVADATVAALVPALVKELQLPQKDLFGNQLIYMLRYAAGGVILPESKSLQAAGVKKGTRLALNSYVLNGSVAALANRGSGGMPATFYSDVTLADAGSFVLGANDAAMPLPAVRKQQQQGWTRRGFLALGGAVLVAGGAGLGLAVYHAMMQRKYALMSNAMMTQTSLTHPRHAPFVPQSATMLLAFMQHQETVRAVGWSPDGMLLASGSDDKQLLLWDTRGNVHMQLQQMGAVRALAWSPDGQQLATGAANIVTFLNPFTGVTLAQSGQSHTMAVTGLAWSPQQPRRLVSVGLDKLAIVWDGDTHMPQTTFRGHASAIESVSWAMDGQNVATSSHGGAIRVWSAVNGQEVHAFYLDGQIPMRALGFTSTGEQLAVGGDDGIVRIWNGLLCQRMGQGQFGKQCLDMPQRLHAHTRPIRALAWSPDARFLATAGGDGILAIWEPAQSQTPLLRVQQHAPVLALHWSPDGRRVATAAGNVVMIWGLL